MKHVLDTCVISELFKARKEPAVVKWISAQNQENLYWSAITVGEIRKRIARLADQEKAQRLTGQFDAFLENFSDRVLSLTPDVMYRWGSLCGESEKRGTVLPVLDSLIAATALEHGMRVATRNVHDLERCGVSVANPWEARD
jgi:predicted nucleic acid-binding protein